MHDSLPTPLKSYECEQKKKVRCLCGQTVLLKSDINVLLEGKGRIYDLLPTKVKIYE